MSAVGVGEEIYLFVHQPALLPFLAERSSLLAVTSSKARGGFPLVLGIQF